MTLDVKGDQEKRFNRDKEEGKNKEAAGGAVQ